MTKDEALDLALEALENCYAYLHEDEDIPVAITAIKQARSAPVQSAERGEPVVWRWTNGKGWLTYGEIPHDRFESTPLYTTPPAAQRQWVGLTDEERDDLLDNYITAEGRARAIEAKLKEKNSDR